MVLIGLAHPFWNTLVFSCVLYDPTLRMCQSSPVIPAFSINTRAKRPLTTGHNLTGLLLFVLPPVKETRNILVLFRAIGGSIAQRVMMGTQC